MTRYIIKNRTGKCDTCSVSYIYRASHSDNTDRVERELNGFTISVTTGKGHWNNHKLCPACIIAVLRDNESRVDIIDTWNNMSKNTIVFLHPYEHTLRILAGDLKE